MSDPKPSMIARILDGFRPIEPPAPARAPRLGRHLAGRRLRLTEEPGGFVGAGLSVLTPVSPAERFRDLNLDAATLDRISTTDLIELLADVSPDVSKALWDFLRMCSPGHTAVALRPSGRPAPAAAQEALRGVLGTIGRRHGDLKVLIGKLFVAAYLRGGVLGELVLDAAGRQTLDLVAPDPAILRWRQAADPDLGAVWRLGQYAGGQWVDLERSTVVYIPIDPLPGKPYGRAPAHPALFPTLFALAMLHDVRRVVQQQGYPRLDFEVVIERLMATMPAGLLPGTEEYQAWLDDAIDAISSFYAELEPDDAFVHTDAVKVNRPVGAADASSLGGIPALMQILERQAVRALKTMPLLMGITDGVSEANANRQWDIHMAGVRSLQQLVENLLERLLTLALEAQGVAAVVQFRFAEVQAGQRLRNAQTEQLEIANAQARYAAGWISQDEAAQAGAGRERADAPAPRTGGVTAPAPVAPAPEENAG